MADQGGRRMRVLHVLGGAAGDGAGQQLRLLIRHLPHHGEVVTLGPPGPVVASMRADGVTVHELKAGGHLATARRLRRIMRLGRFDVVHTHMLRATVPGRLAAWWAGVPRIVASEYHLDAGPVPLGAHVLYLAGERHGRISVAASAAVAGLLRTWGVPRERITVVPKALDGREFRYDPAVRTAVRDRLRIAPGTPVIGGLGRLEPGQRFDRLIRAVGEVPDAVLLLVGDGSARVALERLAVIEGIADRVRFAGATGHAADMLCAMDVFASPGADTYGLAVLEAMAAGLPAVYASCEPLDTGGPRPVDGVRRLTPHDHESLPRALRTEILCVAERNGERLPARSAGPRHDAGPMAEAIARLYAR